MNPTELTLPQARDTPRKERTGSCAWPDANTDCSGFRRRVRAMFDNLVAATNPQHAAGFIKSRHNTHNSIDLRSKLVKRYTSRRASFQHISHLTLTTRHVQHKSYVNAASLVLGQRPSQLNHEQLYSTADFTAEYCVWSSWRTKRRSST